MKIDLSENFPHLTNPPIVEAILDFRCPLVVEWDQERLKAEWQAQLPDYPKVASQRHFSWTARHPSGGASELSTADLGWSGLLFRSADDRQVVQFQRLGFVFSRLAPYSGWERFEAEALRLWKLYIERVRPTAVHRVGLRFLNRIRCPREGFLLGDYLADSPEPLPSLRLRRDSFFHQDTLEVPESEYSVNLVRTLQPAPANSDEVGLILDLDVFTKATSDLDEALLRRRLARMRLLKNQCFFGMITEKIKALCE